MTWAIVAAAHLTAFLGMGFANLLPRPEQSRAIFSLLVVALVLSARGDTYLEGQGLQPGPLNGIEAAPLNLLQFFLGPFRFVVGPLRTQRGNPKAAQFNPAEAPVAQARDEGFAW